MKKLLLIPLLILLSLVALYYQKRPPGMRVTINGHEFIAEVAATPREKEQGLGGRKSLAANAAMVFPYDHDERYGFWMKDMQFPLDFLWIKDKTILDITENVPPPDAEHPLKVIEPFIPVTMIIEVNAGTVARLGIKRGDQIKISF